MLARGRILTRPGMPLIRAWVLHRRWTLMRRRQVVRDQAETDSQAKFEWDTTRKLYFWSSYEYSSNLAKYWATEQQLQTTLWEISGRMKKTKNHWEDPSQHLRLTPNPQTRKSRHCMWSWIIFSEKSQGLYPGSQNSPAVVNSSCWRRNNGRIFLLLEFHISLMEVNLSVSQFGRTYVNHVHNHLKSYSKKPSNPHSQYNSPA